MRKSTKATITAAIGTISRGKYTLLIRLALPMRLFEASASAVAKKLHGSIPANTIKRIGRRAIGGQLGQFAENNREDHHGQEWTDERPGSPDHRLFVTYGDVAPSQHLEKLAVLPQVTPIPPLSATWLDDQFVVAPKKVFAQYLILLVHGNDVRTIDKISLDCEHRRPL